MSRCRWIYWLYKTKAYNIVWREDVSRFGGQSPTETRMRAAVAYYPGGSSPPHPQTITTKLKKTPHTHRTLLVNDNDGTVWNTGLNIYKKTKNLNMFDNLIYFKQTIYKIFFSRNNN